jgi:hypothetical protein
MTQSIIITHVRYVWLAQKAYLKKKKRKKGGSDCILLRRTKPKCLDAACLRTLAIPSFILSLSSAQRKTFMFFKIMLCYFLYALLNTFKIPISLFRRRQDKDKVVLKRLIKGIVHVEADSRCCSHVLPPTLMVTEA